MIRIQARELNGTDWYSWCNFPDQDDRTYFEAFTAHLTSESTDREYRVAPVPTSAGFRADIHLTFDLTDWELAYGGTPDNQTVAEWLGSALRVGTGQVACQVNLITSDEE